MLFGLFEPAVELVGGIETTTVDTGDVQSQLVVVLRVLLNQ
jgi:hypothetical protein